MDNAPDLDKAALDMYMNARAKAQAEPTTTDDKQTREQRIRTVLLNTIDGMVGAPHWLDDEALKTLKKLIDMYDIWQRLMY